ncbi:MAG: TetR/AcrR family transcriptional regulator [Phycisphaerales bacterium]|nr:TetR/AcrR family transcriptional regulator [Phycisphaerales bacterium]
MATQNDTRERILDAAREQFLAHGYQATGISQIVAAAGARSGSLYHFFPTKEDLLLAVLERYRELLMPLVIQPVFDRVSDPIERIFGILDGYRRMLIATDCAIGCPIGNLALEVSESIPNARPLIAANFDGWTSVIEGCLNEAKDRLPEGVNSADLATFILTVMEGGIMQARAHRSLEPFEAGVAILRDYFERLRTDGTTWSTPAGTDTH